MSTSPPYFASPFLLYALASNVLPLCVKLVWLLTEGILFSQKYSWTTFPSNPCIWACGHVIEVEVLSSSQRLEWICGYRPGREISMCNLPGCVLFFCLNVIPMSASESCVEGRTLLLIGFGVCGENKPVLFRRKIWGFFIKTIYRTMLGILWGLF